MQKLPYILQQHLEKTFGLTEARPTQKTIIECLHEKNDLIALLPTGAGKSLCYQLPALAFPGLTIVISPLQSLMHDQVQKLQEKNVAAEFLDSTLLSKKQKEILENVAQNRLKLLYLSPEKLLSRNIFDFMLQQNITHICVDEAHCIYSWGDAFRPEFREIHTFIQKYRAINKTLLVSAFTATATADTLELLKKELLLDDAKIVCQPFVRPNLQYLVLQPPSEAQKRQALLRILQHWRAHDTGSALVYTATRKEAEHLTAWAQSFGFTSAETYHAGLTTQRKESTLLRFLKRPRILLFCTSAFGMGVDKPNIRLVIHHSAPASLEAYAQEVGRAGRDGLEARCVLFYRATELERNLRFQEQDLPITSQKIIRKKALLVESFATSNRCCSKLLFETFLHRLQDKSPQYCSCYRCQPAEWWNNLQKQPRQSPTPPEVQSRVFQLKLQRKLQAEKLKVPPYYLGSDKLLHLIAQRAPKTWQELKEVTGMGHARLFYWGRIILSIMR